MDVSMVRERITNVLKIAGDAYLARVYDEARRKVGADGGRDDPGPAQDPRGHLHDPQQPGGGGAGRDAGMIIILLIALEIVMGLLRPDGGGFLVLFSQTTWEGYP